MWERNSSCFGWRDALRDPCRPVFLLLEDYFVKLVIKSVCLEAGTHFLDAASLHVTRQQGLHVTLPCTLV